MVKGTQIHQPDKLILPVISPTRFKMIVGTHTKITFVFTMQVMDWKPIPLRSEAQSPPRSRKSGNQSTDTRPSVTQLVVGGLVFVGVVVFTVVAATGGFAPASPSPQKPRMAMRPFGIQPLSIIGGATGSGRRRMEETGDEAHGLHTKITCKDGSTTFTPSIDDMWINFMSMSVPSDDEGNDPPGGQTMWDWKKVNGRNNTYKFDNALVMEQVASNDDSVLLDSAPIDTEEQLVRRLSRFIKFSDLTNANQMFGCTSMQEYASGDGSYVCGPGVIDISWQGKGGFNSNLNYDIFAALSEFISGGYSQGLVELKADLQHSPGAVHANSTCVLHTRFDIGNSNGTNKTVMKWVIEPSDSSNYGTNSPYNRPKPSENPDSKYDQRFPGKGWQWVPRKYKSNVWGRPNHTTYHRFTSSPKRYGENSTLRDFVMDRITNGNLAGKTGIVDAWNDDMFTSNTTGGRTLNKLYFEAFGNVFESWMQHYLKVYLEGLRQAGYITERPKNVPVDLWN